MRGMCPPCLLIIIFSIYCNIFFWKVHVYNIEGKCVLRSKYKRDHLAEFTRALKILKYVPSVLQPTFQFHLQFIKREKWKKIWTRTFVFSKDRLDFLWKALLCFFTCSSNLMKEIDFIWIIEIQVSWAQINLCTCKGQIFHENNHGRNVAFYMETTPFQFLTRAHHFA